MPEKTGLNEGRQLAYLRVRNAGEIGINNIRKALEKVGLAPILRGRCNNGIHTVTFGPGNNLNASEIAKALTMAGVSTSVRRDATHDIFYAK